MARGSLERNSARYPKNLEIIEMMDENHVTFAELCNGLGITKNTLRTKMQEEITGEFKQRIEMIIKSVGCDTKMMFKHGLTVGQIKKMPNSKLRLLMEEQMITVPDIAIELKKPVESIRLLFYTEMNSETRDYIYQAVTSIIHKRREETE